MQNFFENYKPTSQVYFESLFETYLDWKKICMMTRKTTVDTFTRMFHYKIINNVLYLNKMLFVFKKFDSPLCSSCKVQDETPLHLFYDITLFFLVTRHLWKQLCSLCSHRIVIPKLTPQSAKFGFLDSNHNNEILINHILLIFKLYIYRCRDSGAISILNLKTKISMVRDTEKVISKS